MPKKFTDHLRLPAFHLNPAKLGKDGSRASAPFAVLPLIHEGRKIERFLAFLAGVGCHLVTVAIYLTPDPADVAGGDLAPAWTGFGQLGKLSMAQPTREQDHPIGTVPLTIPSADVAALLSLSKVWLDLVASDDLRAVLVFDLAQKSLLEEAAAATAPPAPKK